jgi:hypothetical protein
MTNHPTSDATPLRPTEPAPGSPGPAGNPDTYRGWTISYDPPPIPIRYFDWIAQGPNFDASYEGEEDGWVGNGEQVHASTRGELIEEIDAWFEENDQ